jgi:heptosyltransferase-2
VRRGAIVIRTETSAAKKILIRGTNWVGDSVISIPAMKEIRQLFPGAHISLLVRPWVRDIFSTVDFVDEVLEYDKNGYHRGLIGFHRLISDLRNRRFDLAILLQNAFEAAFIAWCARIPRRIGYARDGRSLLLTDAIAMDPEVQSVHQAYYYLGILSGLGLLPPHPWQSGSYPLSVHIGVQDADRTAAREILQSCGIRDGDIVVGINPGAFYGEAKRWFPDRYAGVADSLADRYKAHILLFGAQSDLRIVEDVAAHMKHSSVILAGKTTLGQLMGLLKECTLLITNDSGPMHLAAALDVPQLAIFGSTSEIATGPLNRDAMVIKHPVACNPCFLRKCPTDFCCMKEVTIRQVLEAAQRVLEEHGRGQM